MTPMNFMWHRKCARAQMDATDANLSSHQETPDAIRNVTNSAATPEIERALSTACTPDHPDFDPCKEINDAKKQETSKKTLGVTFCCLTANPNNIFGTCKHPDCNC